MASSSSTTDQAKLVEELARLREVAEKATPGPWVVRNAIGIACKPKDGLFRKGDDVGHVYQRGNHHANAAYIATFDPPTTIHLLDLLASKDGELKASEIMRNLLSANLERRTEALVAAEALTLSLRAENERLRGALRTISNGTEDRAPPFRAIGPSQMAGIARAALSQSTGDTK